MCVFSHREWNNTICLYFRCLINIIYINQSTRQFDIQIEPDVLYLKYVYVEDLLYPSLYKAIEMTSRFPDALVCTVADVV